MRKRDTSILQELRKPMEDTEIGDQEDLPDLPRVPGLQLTSTGFADLLMVFEFLHNFGETLGFMETTADMESLPSLQTLHTALTSENAVEAEEEMLTVMTHLLVCAIEDPGIPNPGRHTTLLGQTLRQADITHSNVSEILRIYLYAVAHGEVRQQSGINLERERERHHLPTEEDIKTASDKNRQFYELLAENVRYKLSEQLKDKPFVAINPTTKAEILAMLCNDLLMNKAVLKQIEGSLDTQAQLKKERYLLDNKIRKYKMLVARKQRLEQYERAQAAALEKSLSMKAAEEAAKRAEEAAALAGESTTTTDQPLAQQGEEKTEGMEVENVDGTAPVSCAATATDGTNPAPAQAQLPEAEQNHKDEVPINPSQESMSLNNGTSTPMEESPIKAPPTPVQDEPTAIKPKEMNFTNEINDISGLNVSQQQSNSGGELDNPFSKSMIHDAPSERNDDSDLESEGTQLEEDEDATLTAEEAQKKYDKILETSFQNKQQLEHALNQLRVKCFGQDRYWRRYWNLTKCGGIYVESMESAQLDVYKYQNGLDEIHASQVEAEENPAVEKEAAITADAIEPTVNDETSFGAGGPLDETIPPEEDIPRFIPTIADIVKRDRDKNKENKDANDFSHQLEERKRKRTGRSKKKHDFFNQENTNDSESQDVQEEDNSRTSFSNCDETRTDSQSEAEPQAAPAEAAKVATDPQPPPVPPATAAAAATVQPQQPPVPVPIQLGAAKQKRDDDHLMDIEDSIPTAILVQKGNDHDQTKIVEVNNQIGGINMNRQQDDADVELIQEETPTITIPDDDTMDGDTGANRDPAEGAGSVEQQQESAMTTTTTTTNGGSNCDMKPKLENGEIGPGVGEDGKPMYGPDGEVLGVIPEVKVQTKKEDYTMERWFSIVDKELPLTSTECPLPCLKGTTPASIARQVYTNITCKEICQIQGNRWDIGNNIQFFSVPLEKTVEINLKNESILSMSGLDDAEMYEVISKRVKKDPEQLADLKPSLPILVPKRESVDGSFGEIKSEMKQEGGEHEEFGSFSLPAYMTLTLSNLTAYVQCDQFQPLQMTPEEEKQMEEIKQFGTLKKPEIKPIRKYLRHGWWKLNEIEELNELLKYLNPRGVRERSLRQNLLESLAESVNLMTPYPVACPQTSTAQTDWVESEAWNAWNPAIARRVEIALLDQIEAMEDKVASASMQIKGWQMPQRDGDSDSDIVENVTIEMLRERISGLEAAIERRYLKPPLGINSTEAQMAAIAHHDSHHSIGNTSTCSNSSDDENIPKGLVSWRDAVERSVTTAQLSMALYVLESCIAWDKSIMKANCQFCQSGEQEDKLLLCDGCDRGYHTYCFKPIMDKIPDGDWYCYECKNKATGDRKCIVCGGMRPPPLGKMVYCELCPRAYHQDCYIPPMLKYPRGKWYCTNCASKAPPKKKPQRKPPKEKEKQGHNTSSAGLNTSTLSNQSANHSLNSSHEEIPPVTPIPSTLSSPGGTPLPGHPPQLQHCSINNNSSPHLAVNSVVAPALSPANSVASTTNEEPSSTGGTGSGQCLATPSQSQDFSTAHQQHHQQQQQQQPQTIAFPAHQYANLEGTAVSSVLNSFQLPLPPLATAASTAGGSNNFDPQQYYQSQQQHQLHQFYPQQQQQQSQTVNDSESHGTVAGQQPNDNSSSMENSSLNASMGSVDESQYDTSGQRLASENNSYSPVGYESDRGLVPESSDEPMLQQQQQSHSSSSSGSHKSAKKDRKERDEAKEQAKKEKKANKKLMKELAPCKTVLEEMEVHEHSWPFLLPVNTKQFPTYRKVIKYPMDLSTIKKRLQDLVYKSREDFLNDVRLIFDNCEMFNEDDSPVGTAGHGMRQYLERRWAELTEKPATQQPQQQQPSSMQDQQHSGSSS
ncbi:uncharacterized protein LOC129748778 [Uranotaenia lowii]|uniref:uncharacterized protein LOC129748778 n=1 Tax=Uranotaenia lowii TaxID=190385 RepID=UPI002478E344|nr:uncharacterized protein LOC129748778 [Uranotaenia lowii]